MATPQVVYRHDLNGLNSAQLIGMRDQNVTDAQMTALAATLGVKNKGLRVYNTTQDQPFFWDGSAFKPVAVDLAGDRGIRGVVDATQPLVGQTDNVSGNEYLVTKAGTLPATLTFASGTVTVVGDTNEDGVIEVEVGDSIVFIDTTGAGADVKNRQSGRANFAYVFQRNLEQATEVALGTVRLATQGEVNAGTVADEAITPATLRGFFNAQRIPRQYSATVNVSTPAANPDDGYEVTVTHGLGLADKRDFVAQTVTGNMVDSLAIEVIDANSIKLKALDPTPDVRINIVANGSTYAA